MEHNNSLNGETWFPYPIKIAGVGRYLPGRVVTSKELEGQCGLDAGWCQTRHGVKQRRWVKDETASFMGAQAAREAVADAGLDLWDLDLIINASMSFERRLPDGGPLLQQQMGLEDSGIPCFTLNANCNSFLAALEASINLTAVGSYRNILIVSAEVLSHIIDPHYPEAYTLFADGAAAVVLTLTPENETSKVQQIRLETYSHGIPFLKSLYGYAAAHQNVENPRDLALQLDTQSFTENGIKYSGEIIKKLCPAHSTENVACVIPQQWGQAFLDYLENMFPGDRLTRIFDTYGFCGAASLPMALYEAVKEKKLKRGDQVLMVGYAAGLNVGGAVLTY